MLTDTVTTRKVGYTLELLFVILCVSPSRPSPFLIPTTPPFFTPTTRRAHTILYASPCALVQRCLRGPKIRDVTPGAYSLSLSLHYCSSKLTMRYIYIDIYCARVYLTNTPPPNTFISANFSILAYLKLAIRISTRRPLRRNHDFSVRIISIELCQHRSFIRVYGFCYNEIKR